MAQETDQEVKELENKLKNTEIKTFPLKWRIILLVVIILVFVGSYFFGVFV